ncbi:MAG: DUF4965 domain-containing protein [Clostridia bacterium]|nr:DUF4965 domain-containing protein [Clostridia bacterium]
MKALRAPAYPLITVDPHFSIWSGADNLYDTVTRHWSSERQNMYGTVKIDGKLHKFMGKLYCDDLYDSEPRTLTQKSVTVRPLSTVYTFENESVRLTVTFMTPLLPDDLMLLSRPVSYMAYTIESLDGAEHTVELAVHLNGSIAINRPEFDPDQTMTFKKYECGAYCGRGNKEILSRSGDALNIDWGYLHIFGNGFKPVIRDMTNFRFEAANCVRDDLADGEYLANNAYPSIGLVKSYQVCPDTKADDFLCIAYDDIHSIDYFGEHIDAYYKKNGDTFKAVCKKAIRDYGKISKKVLRFEKRMLTDARRVGGRKYADILSLAYRQTIAGHKLTYHNGEMQFFSKECGSNGCIATVDVTYPSIPMFLKYNPSLVFAMLNPVFRYADMSDWKYEFAPHDVGTYPMATGQVYGYGKTEAEQKYEEQMPVEECGNMIICTVAACHELKDYSYFKEHKKILAKWAEYLAENGYNPENQLCTDDFTGRMPHNCNLSLKAIVALGAYARACELTGDTASAQKYSALAKKYAKLWETETLDGDHHRLAFDREGTWSLKYNIIWDKYFGLGLFTEEVYKREVAYYKTKVTKYGIPLDCRGSVTTTNWPMWTTVMTKDDEYMKAVVDGIWNMADATPDRVAFIDLYDVDKLKCRSFRGRTVQGGLFVNLLDFEA